MIRRLIAATIALGLSACTTLGELPTKRVATATLRFANGAPAGEAIVTASGDSLTLSVAALGLPGGAHGVHLHMVGTCDAPAFTSAGGHLNPAGHQHGTANPAGSHLGDLPNLIANTAGVASLSANLAATRAEAEAALFDSDGTALVIHAAADDYKTDPSGNSGSRIACGVIKRS
ncbi:MAG: superoxide dismutase family protein [Novosphingobium sp.]